MSEVVYTGEGATMSMQSEADEELGYMGLWLIISACVVVAGIALAMGVLA